MIAYLSALWPAPRNPLYCCWISSISIAKLAKRWGTPELRVRGHLDKRQGITVSLPYERKPGSLLNHGCNGGRMMKSLGTALLVSIITFNILMWMLNGLKDRVCALEKATGKNFQPTSFSQGVCKP